MAHMQLRRLDPERICLSDKLVKVWALHRNLGTDSFDASFTHTVETPVVEGVELGSPTTFCIVTPTCLGHLEDEP